MTTEESPKREDDAWKEKLQEQKELLKQKEKEWRDADSTLRRGISRLSFAMGGIDGKLDKQLGELRDAIRENYSTNNISDLINSIADLVKHLDDSQSAAKNGPAPGNEVALRILRGVGFPLPQRKPAKKLLQRYEAADGDDDALHAELAALLHDSVTTATAGARGGFFSRLFGSAPDPRPTTPASAPEDTAPADQSVAEDTQSPNLAKSLLADLFHRIEVREEDAFSIKSLRHRLEQTASNAELQIIVTDFSEVLNASRITRSNTPDNTEASGEVATPPTIQEVLIQFVDELAIPSDLVEESTRIKERLVRNDSDDNFPAAFKSIVDLVINMRKTLVQEKQELEDFLRQLTQRLQEMDQHLGGTQSHQQTWAEVGRKLEAAVQSQVREIKTTVHDASDLHMLKTNIKDRLDVLQTHLDEYQRSEEHRQEQLATELSQVKSRLDNVEQEAGQLRVRLKDKHQQAIIDPLTGIFNRLAYEERITQEMARWKRYKNPISLVVLDVDHFKHINDHYGHKAGDKALKLIAQVLKDSLRETDFIARYGGEEFVALVTETPLEKIQGIAEKLRAAVEGCKFHYAGKDVPITISCGYSAFRGDDSAEVVFNRADAALYRAKGLGRNQCCNADTPA